MVNVLYFVGSFAMGGTERHLSQVLPALAQRGWSIDVIVLADGGAFADQVRGAGINIEVLPQGFTVPVPRLRGAMALIQQTYALANRLRREPPHILHCFLPSCCEIGGFAARKVGFSPVVMSRRSQASRPALFPGDKRLERWALRHADVVFGHSKVVIDELKSEGIAAGRLRLNHNGIDLEAFGRAAGRRADIRRTEGWQDDEIVFAVVANLIPYKGHIDLLRAFAKLEDTEHRWRLALIGQGDPAYTAQLQQMAIEMGFTTQVGFLGARDDVPSLLKAADVGILPSHQEGFPNAILEYMAAGLPVIATAVGGNLDAVDDKKTGLLVPPFAPDMLAETVLLLLGDAELRLALGSAGRRRAATEFSFDACVKRYEDTYRRLIGARLEGKMTI